METIELLKPAGPKAELFLNMNTVYFRLDQNLNCSSLEFTAIRMAFTAVVDGEADPTLDYQSYEIPTWRLNDLVSHDEVPDYNVEVDIKNLMYRFDFTFVFEYFDNEDGSVEMYSKTNTVHVDNRETIINSKATNNIILGDLNNDLINRDDFTLFFEYPDPIDITNSNLKDVIITLGGVRMTQIKEYRSDGTIIISTPTEVYHNFINYIIYHPDLPRIVNGLLVGTGIQTLKFKLLRNKEILYCTLTGDLTKLKEENERIPSEL